MPSRRAVEGKAGRDVGRLADQQLNVEAEVGNTREILDEHRTVAGQLERSAVVLDIVIDVAPKLSPVLTVQAVDVGAVEFRQGRNGQERFSTA